MAPGGQIEAQTPHPAQSTASTLALRASLSQTRAGHRKAPVAWAAFGYHVLRIGVLLLPFMLILLLFGVAMGIFVWP